MAQIDKKEVLKVEVMSVQEFCDTYTEGVQRSAIYYAMDNDLIDYTSFGGRERLVVMTDKTRAYKPNSSPKRMTSRMNLES